MKKPAKSLRVLLSGAGGAGTIEVIKHLKLRGFWVAAVDMDPYAVGLYLADLGLVMPAVTSKDYFKRIAALVQKHKIDAYVPLIDEELIKAKELEAGLSHVRVITPRREFMEFVLNKLSMTSRLISDGIQCPQTWPACATGPGMSWSKKIVKPIRGRGSRGFSVIDSKDDWKNYCRESGYHLNQLMIQERVEGVEYTVSAVVGHRGDVLSVVPKRIIQKKGITLQSETVRHPRIEKLIHLIQEKYLANGPFNVQLMERGQELFILEINPRFSTTVAQTIAAGVDEVGLLVEDFCLGKVSQRPKSFQQGLVMMRYLSQIYVKNASVKGRVKSRI